MTTSKDISATGTAQHWNSVAGQYVTAWEQATVCAWVSDLFGYYAIQLGHHARLSCLRENRCTERYWIEQGHEHPSPSRADEFDMRRLDVPDFAVLPFESDSIDVVVLPHTLDEHADPHGVLREAYRVLRPEGRMIILGFNPLSLWGVQAKLRRNQQAFGFYPKLPHAPLSIGRIKDWVELLNCDVVRGQYGCYAPYVLQDKWLQRSAWLEKAGDRWWGFAGAAYAVMVVKRVYTPTLVGLINEKKSAKKWTVQPVVKNIET